MLHEEGKDANDCQRQSTSGAELRDGGKLDVTLPGGRERPHVDDVRTRAGIEKDGDGYHDLGGEPCQSQDAMVGRLEQRDLGIFSSMEWKGACLVHDGDDEVGDQWGSGGGSRSGIWWVIGQLGSGVREMV